MQVIITTYTNDPQQRPVIRAEWLGKTVQLPYDRDLGLDDNHVQAASHLARLLGWAYDFACGRLASGDYCHVPLRQHRQFTTHTAPGASSPPDAWRGIGGGSLEPPRRGTTA